MRFVHVAFFLVVNVGFASRVVPLLSVVEGCDKEARRVYEIEAYTPV